MGQSLNRLFIDEMVGYNNADSLSELTRTYMRDPGLLDDSRRLWFQNRLLSRLHLCCERVDISESELCRRLLIACALKKGDLKELDNLLQSDPDQLLFGGQPVLAAALSFTEPDKLPAVIKYLLDKGADPYKKDANGTDAFALSLTSREALSTFLDYFPYSKLSSFVNTMYSGIRIRSHDKEKGGHASPGDDEEITGTPLMMACHYDDEASVRKLLRCGACGPKKLYQSLYGAALLRCACARQDSCRALTALCENNFDHHSSNIINLVVWALYYNKTSHVKILLQKGVDASDIQSRLKKIEVWDSLTGPAKELVVKYIKANVLPQSTISKIRELSESSLLIGWSTLYSLAAGVAAFCMFISGVLVSIIYGLGTLAHNFASAVAFRGSSCGNSLSAGSDQIKTVCVNNQSKDAQGCQQSPSRSRRESEEPDIIALFTEIPPPPLAGEDITVTHAAAFRDRAPTSMKDISIAPVSRIVDSLSFCVM